MEGGYFNSVIGMAHELIHAYRHNRGFYKLGTKEYYDVKKREEENAISFENYIRDSYSWLPYREYYWGYTDENWHMFESIERITDFKSLDVINNGKIRGYSFKKSIVANNKKKRHTTTYIS